MIEMNYIDIREEENIVADVFIEQVKGGELLESI